MLKFVLKRTLAGIGALVAVSLFIFFAIDALPGDAATAVLGSSATAESLAQLRAEFGLDRPAIVRYLDWMVAFLQGDLGRAMPSGTPIAEVLGPRILNTTLLAAFTLLFLVPIGLLLGTLAGARESSRLDRGVSVATLVFYSIPEFVIGAFFLLLFATWIPLFPAVSILDPWQSPLSQMQAFVLPMLTLLFAGVAQTARMVRASMTQVMHSPYIAMARLKGVPEWRVIVEHALPNSLGPALQIIAINLGWLFGGVVVVEAVFEFPGIGTALTEAVSTRDVATVQSLSLLITGVFLVGSVLADILAAIVNPRLRRTL
ncbi:MAG: ABC transporter permease [Microbacterium sp.]